MNLSANEAKVIAHFSTEGFTSWSSDTNGAWADAFKQQIADVCGISVVGARGVLASLVKKKLFTTTWNDEDKAQWIALGHVGTDAIATFREALDRAPGQEDEVLEAIEQEASAGETEPAKPATRTSHTECIHAKAGAEGKKARAACRRERAKQSAE